MKTSESQTTTQYAFKGSHVISEFYGVKKCLLDNPQRLLQAMRAALTSIDTTIIDETVHRFAPEGVTALFLLAESHASLHTYPAQGAAFFDIFTCGSSDPKKAMRALEQTLQPTFKNCTYITRGEDQ